MNSDFSNLPPEERAQLLTALLLGELPLAEADALRAALAADPELAREHARLQQTIALVRETSAMDRKTSADGTPLRLDEQRRAKLLAAFKAPAPRFVAPRRRRNFSYVPLSIAAVLVGLLALVAALPLFVKSRVSSQLAFQLPRGGSPDKTAADFDSYQLAENSARRYALGDTKSANSREGEVRLKERLSDSDFSDKLTPIRPASRALKSPPVVALVLPTVKDTDSDASAPMLGRAQVSGQLQTLSDLSEEQLITRGLREDSKRSGVARDLTRADDYGYALAAGDSVGLKPSAANPVPARGLSSQLSTPTITTASGRLTTTPVPTVNYAITDLERSSSVPPASGPAALAKNLNLGETKMLGSIAAGMAPVPTSPPVEAPALPAGSGSADRTVRAANLANLYADVALVPESEVEQKARFDSGGLAGGGGSVTIQNEGLFLANEYSTPSPRAGLAPKATITPTEAQGIIEARRLQLRASGPASPRILPPTALGLEIKSAEQAQVATKSYAEEARVREINSKQLLTEVEQAWSEPTAPTTPLADGFFKLDQSPRGTENKGVTARGGLVGGDAVGGLPVEAFSFGGAQNRSGGGGGGRGGGGSKGPGAGFGSFGGAAYAGVSIAPGGTQGRSGGIDSLSDGIAVTPPAPVSASAGLGKVTEFDTAARTPNPVDQPAQFGFELAANPTSAPEGMVDALEAIRKTPSYAGAAVASSRGQTIKGIDFSAIPSQPSGGSVSFARRPVSEPVIDAARFADDGAVVWMNGTTVVRTNALVSNDSWGVNANRSAADQGAYWFGNTAQDNVQWDYITPISDGEKTASPVEGRFKTIGDSTALNYQWRIAGAGVAKDQPAGGVDGRLNASGTGIGRRMNSTVTRAGKTVVSDPVANASPTTHEFLGDNFAVVPTSERGRTAGDVNGRVTVQLPALAGEPQLSRHSSPTRPAGGRQSELASEDSGPVVAEPAPANVAMTGITTLPNGAAVKFLEMKEQAAPVEETKRPADSGMHIVFANSGSVLPITNGVAAATAANMLVTDLATSGSLPAVSPPGATFNQLGFGEMSEELSQRQSVRDKLKRNIDATEVELKTLKQGSVDILELAEAGSPAKPSLWGRVAGAFSSEVQRGTRISVEQDMPDADATGRGFMAGYRPTPDPFFTQTELERIQSKPVLGKVVEKLKLDEEWAKKTGAKLSQDEAVALLKKKLDVRQDAKTTLIDIRAKSESAEEAARLANAVAQAYAETRKERHQELVGKGMVVLREQLAEKDKQVAEAKQQLEQRLKERVSEREETNRPKPSAASPTPQPEVLTRDNAFSTFSLNVSDVSFKLAAASLEKGAMPDVATVRSEEFINAFDYRDAVPAAGVPLAFVSERARYPFAHNRDVLRFSVKTAAQGRDGGRPLNIVLLLDNSGSMERADRVRIIQEALRALAAQLQPQDKLSVVTFSRTARLWADGVTGAQAAEVAGKIAALTPEGGTNLEEALDLAYRTALRHYAATAMNRVVLLTDGAANLGNVEPAALKAKVENFRKQGVALDCFGIGWEGFNDDLLENLSRNGDGHYGFVNTPEEASTEFAAQLAGALQVAASDVKVQVEFNPKRVTAYRQIGYAKHQLTKQQFRDNTVDAAEISASEAGNALYVIEINPRGEGPIATVRARFRVPQTSDYREHEWVVPFGSAVELEQSGSALRLAASASAFSEWLAGSPFAGEVTTDRLLGLLSGVPEVYGADPRPKKLEWMIRQAKSISGK